MTSQPLLAMKRIPKSNNLKNLYKKSIIHAEIIKTHFSMKNIEAVIKKTTDPTKIAEYLPKIKAAQFDKNDIVTLLKIAVLTEDENLLEILLEYTDDIDLFKEVSK